jgi:hypothetical protein
MAKRYTKAEWTRMQSRLPREDRTPYEQSPEAPAVEGLAKSVETLRSDVSSRRSAIDLDLKQAAADKQAALDAKKAAEQALIEITGATTLAGAKNAAAKRDVSRNPAVIQANRALAEANARAQDLQGDGDTGFKPEPFDEEAYRRAETARIEAEEKRRAGQSAYTLLFEEFNRYGLGGLVEPLQALIVQGLSEAEFTLKLRETQAYQNRFAANKQRIAKGLRALSEAEYIGLEDQYQSVMRQYGLPDTYYTRGDMGRQAGFEQFIAGDVSPVELEDRIQTAQNRVLNAPGQIKDALAQFYGGEITNGDVLAYVLDPQKALPEIKRKVTAAEIGGAAAMAGLGATRTRAEELGMFGVTGEQARTGYQSIAEFLPTAQKLGDIYAKQGMGPFTQTTAEQEVFGTAGAAEAGRKRRKLTELETAAFSGQAGVAGGALARERAGQY